MSFEMRGLKCSASRNPHLQHTRMTPDEQRFWLLFGEYERLVEEETFALKEQNFDYVQTVLNKKQAILRSLSSLEETIDAHRDDWQDLEVRLGAVQSRQKGNSVFLDEMIHDVQGTWSVLMLSKTASRACAVLTSEDSERAGSIPVLAILLNRAAAFLICGVLFKNLCRECSEHGLVKGKGDERITHIDKSENLVYIDHNVAV